MTRNQYDRFRKFHIENPNVYQVFIHYAMEMRKVRECYPAETVLARVKWHMDIRTKGEAFKAGPWGAFYARLALLQFPKELGGFFRTRPLKSGVSEEEFKTLLELHHAPYQEDEDLGSDVPGTEAASPIEDSSGGGPQGVPGLDSEEDIFS